MSRVTNVNQNPPTGLFNLPDRQRALHNKVDFMSQLA